MPDKPITCASPPLLTEDQLHPYQVFCVGFIEQNPQCALLLDCGLGKTIVTLTAIEHLLHDSYEASRILIIAPLRVDCDTWLNELSKWAHLKERVIGTEEELIAAVKAQIQEVV